jgi:murein L,D-transpeptidase YafK
MPPNPVKRWTVAILFSGLLCGMPALAEDPLKLAYVGPSETPGRSPVGVPVGLIYEDLENPYLFWAELESGRIHMLERVSKGRYRKHNTLPISIGKHGIGKEVEGDKKTPVGVYQITGFLSDEQLDDFYGVGAYPFNFPNIWDRLRKRTGHGIWLHGLPKGMESRPRLDSDGCVIIDNASITQMDQYVDAGSSLVVLARTLEWLPVGTPQRDADVLEAIDGWHAAWEANDRERYLSSYHVEFTDTRRDLAQWKAYKTRVNRAKTFIDVDLTELSVIEYPGEPNLITVRFFQRYRSSNYNWEGWKQLLWRRDDGGVWRILYEGNG